MEPYVSGTVVLRRHRERSFNWSCLRGMSVAGMVVLLLGAYQMVDMPGIGSFRVVEANAAASTTPVIDHNAEIGSQLYSILRSDLEDVPGLRGPIRDALGDRVITRAEYNRIRAIKLNADPTDAKAALEHDLDASALTWNAGPVLKMGHR